MLSSYAKYVWYSGTLFYDLSTEQLKTGLQPETIIGGRLQCLLCCLLFEPPDCGYDGPQLGWCTLTYQNGYQTTTRT